MLFFTSEHHAKSAGFSSSLTIKIKKKKMKPDLNLTKWNKASIYLSHSWKTKPSIWPPNMLGQLLLEQNTLIHSECITPPTWI